MKWRGHIIASNLGALMCSVLTQETERRCEATLFAYGENHMCNRTAHPQDERHRAGAGGERVTWAVGA